MIYLNQSLRFFATFSVLFPIALAFGPGDALAGLKSPDSDYQAPVQLAADPDSSEHARWTAIQNSNTSQDFIAFLADYPDSAFAPIATSRLLALLNEEAAKTSSTGSTTQSASTGNTGSTSVSGTGKNRFDGLWKITATHLHSPYGRIPFCRSRETMQATFTVKYGEFEQQSRTNKGAPVNIEGSFSRSGKLKLDVIPWGPKESGGWGNNVERGDLRIEENMNGKQRVRKTVGEDCKVELVLVRQ